MFLFLALYGFFLTAGNGKLQRRCQAAFRQKIEDSKDLNKGNILQKMCKTERKSC